MTFRKRPQNDSQIYIEMCKYVCVCVRVCASPIFADLSIRHSS